MLIVRRQQLIYQLAQTRYILKPALHQKRELITEKPEMPRVKLEQREAESENENERGDGSVRERTVDPRQPAIDQIAPSLIA